LTPSRGRRNRSDRHRPNRTWRKWLAVVSKATLGLLLVGCATIPGFKRNEPLDPIATLQNGTDGNQRIESYRKLAQVETLPAEQQAVARKLLIDGAINEYNILARSAAITALAKIPDDEATRILLSALDDRNAVIRAEAIHSLQNRKTPEVVAAIRQRLSNDIDADVRIAAVEALTALNDRELVPVLIESLRDGEHAVVSRAAEGLREITQAPVQGDKYLDWKAWADGTPRPPQDIEQTAEKSRWSGLMDIFRR
jgi:HEAT repeat protein